MLSTLGINDDEPPSERRGNPPVFSPGDVLAERFVIISFLARGGMGEVYEAKDRVLQGAPIALKALTSSKEGSTAAQDRFKKEVLLARQISHPNVCPIYDLFFYGDAADRHCFLTMKLLRGESLAARLKRQERLPEIEAWPIIQQISSALRAAHEANVVHRDFKPGNIMLDGSGADVKATVTDFGLARDKYSDTTVTLGEIWGTRGYIAPEVLAGKPASAASDLYSFGVVLHEIYTGRRPDAKLTQPISTGPHDSTLKDVPRFSERLIRACLDPDPGKRCRAFEHALGVLDRKSHSSNAYSSTSRFSRRVFLGAAAGIGGLAAAAWWQRDDFLRLLNPLPAKRFVALITWPMPKDTQLGPLLSGVLESIASELAKAELSDRNLLIISPRDVQKSGTDVAHLNLCCDAVGANLALAATGTAGATHFNISLRLLDAATSAVLREREIHIAANRITELTAKMVAAAAYLLDLKIDDAKTKTANATDSPEAFQLFQKAQADFATLNDGGLDSAIEGFGKAVTADPHYVKAYGELALAYGRKFAVTTDASYLDLARANANAALRLDDRAVSAYVASAEVFQDQGKQVEAIQEIQKALAYDPENYTTLNAEAAIYERFNRFQDAETTYRRVLALRPNHWLTYNRLGALLVQQGGYQEGLKNFHLAQALAPRSSIVLNNVGGIALKLGLLKDAEASFQNSLRIKADDSCCYNLSQVYLVQGRHKEALRFALKAADLHSADDTNWLQVADCYQQMPGKSREAIETYKKALEVVTRRLQIDNTDGKAWMLMALYRAKIEPAFDATALVQKAELLGSSDLDSQMTKVRILELARKRSSALATLSECFKRGTTPFEVTLVPDLDGLRRDPGYTRYENASYSGNKI